MRGTTTRTGHQGVRFAISAILIAGIGNPAQAHRDDYINETFVFETLGAREFEPEVFLDFVRPSDGVPARGYALAFEYGVTEHWMVDAFLGWRDPADADTSFRRSRVETRYRFGEEGDRAVDIAASLEAEYEQELEPGGEEFKVYVLTPRLVLSRDIGADFNLTMNLDLGREFRIGLPDRWIPGYALGGRYPREATVRYGLEFRQDFGDERSSLVVPQIWFSLPRDATLKFGAGFELEGSEAEDFLRAVFEMEF